MWYFFYENSFRFISTSIIYIHNTPPFVYNINEVKKSPPFPLLCCLKAVHGLVLSDRGALGIATVCVALL